MKDVYNTIIELSLFQNFELSLRLSALMGFIVSFSVPILGTWIEGNLDYVKIALGIIAIDHLIGSWVHRIIKNDWCWKLNIVGFLVKLSMVVAFGFIMEGLAHITIEDDFIYTYIKMSGRILVCLYPGISAMKNMRIITKGTFPPDIFFGNMKKTYETGDINKLKDNNDATS